MKRKCWSFTAAFQNSFTESVVLASRVISVRCVVFLHSRHQISTVTVVQARCGLLRTWIKALHDFIAQPVLAASNVVPIRAAFFRFQGRHEWLTIRVLLAGLDLVAACIIAVAVVTTVAVVVVTSLIVSGG